MERPIGWHGMHKLYAKSLSTLICETIDKLGVDLMFCVAQYSDGASVKTGKFNELQAKLEVPRELQRRRILVQFMYTVTPTD